MYIANIYSVYIERALEWRLRFYCLRNLISSNSYVYLERTCSSSHREHREILTKLTIFKLCNTYFMTFKISHTTIFDLQF